MEPVTKQNLLPCPCCGADAALAEAVYDGNIRTKGFIALCPDCQLQTLDVAAGDQMNGDVEWEISLEQAKAIERLPI